MPHICQCASIRIGSSIKSQIPYPPFAGMAFPDRTRADNAHGVWSAEPGLVEAVIPTVAFEEVNATAVAAGAAAATPECRLKHDSRGPIHAPSKKVTVPIDTHSHKRRWTIEVFVHRATNPLIHLR